MTLKVLVSPFGNAQAIVNAYKELGISGFTAANASELLDSSHIVIPGVGNFGALMRFLKENGYEETLRYCTNQGTKILGVCVGMQVLCNSSEESPGESGLGLLDVQCIKLDSNFGKVPHVGWNDVANVNKHELTYGLDENFPAFFAHSFHVPVTPGLTISHTKDGFSMTAVLAKGNVSGVQFHPERSQKNGLRILRNFYEWNS